MAALSEHNQQSPHRRPISAHRRLSAGFRLQFELLCLKMFARQPGNKEIYEPHHRRD
jgi:hypothetical protein